MHYFITFLGLEVDFLIKEGLRIKQLIQATYANDFNEIDRIEIRALNMIQNSHNIGLRG